MAYIPILEKLSVDGFALYPGTSSRHGLSHEFKPGLSLVLGANGLGKTTLVSILHRMCAGPYDMPKLKSGGEFGGRAVQSRKLNSRERKTFARRVSDGAESATATLRFSLGSTDICVTRSLRNLDLSALEIDGEEASQVTEAAYQEAVVEASGVPTFGDWLFLLRYLVFYFEDRRQLVWDASAQRQLLRLLCLDRSVAKDWADSERSVRQLDSRMRNLRATLTAEEQAVAEATEVVADEEAVRAELKAIEPLLQQDVDRLEELQDELLELETAQETGRLEHLKAQAAHESASRDLERLHLAAIESAFPSAEETGRYLLTRLMMENVCLTCGNPAEDAALQLRRRVETAHCIVCGSALEAATSALGARAISNAQKTLEAASDRVFSTRHDREEAEEAFSSALSEIQELKTNIATRRQRRAALIGQLPPEEAELHEQLQELAQMRSRLELIAQNLTRERREFAEFIDGVNDELANSQEAIKEAFDSLAEQFLLEECRLVWGEYKAKVGESGEAIDFAGFQLEMGGASFEEPVRRTSSDQVSESQREFIDLAFRMALLEAATSDGVGSLVVDAPESSLDAVFVKRAAEILARFAKPSLGNRLVITSNLIEGDLIPELASRTRINSSRSKRVLDLFSVAAPTTATRELASEYREVKERAFST